MSDALSYSVELAAERSSNRHFLERILKSHGLSYDTLEGRLEKLGIKKISLDIVDCLTCLKHGDGVYNILDALIESGYKYYNEDRLIDDSKLSSAIYLLDADSDTPSRYLSVFKKLKGKLGYKTVDIPYDQLYQIDKVYKISRFGGEDVCKTIDALAEVGYNLHSTKGKKWLTYDDVNIISKFSKLNVDNFLKTFSKLKEKFRYKSISKKPFQLGHLIQISETPWSLIAIDYLAACGYKIINKNCITSSDVTEIKHTSDKLLKSSLESYLPCLYKGHPVKFIEYFKSLDVEDKKTAIKSILNCDEVSNDQGVIEWLDKEYPELVREVGLGLV